VPAVCTPHAEIVPSIPDRVVNCGELFLFVMASSVFVSLFKVVVIFFSTLHTGPDKEHKVFQIFGTIQARICIFHLKSAKVSLAKAVS
jgi:hypothetical protein